MAMENVERIILPVSFTTWVLQIHCQFLFEMGLNDTKLSFSIFPGSHIVSLYLIIDHSSSLSHKANLN